MSLSRLRERDGQAAVEMMGALPVVLLLGLVVLQLLAVGYASVIAGQAAESAALAVAGGGDAEEAARAAVPGWSRARMQVDVRGGRVQVSMRPPAAIDAVARKLEVHAAAEVGAP
jgi:Flp pilus assembly protein TadG